MTDPIENLQPGAPLPGANPAETGLPLLRTWAAVYAFILAVFALIVIVLILFTRAYA